jgi:hypothetical protein
MPMSPHPKTGSIARISKDFLVGMAIVPVVFSVFWFTGIGKFRPRYPRGFSEFVTYFKNDPQQVILLWIFFSALYALFQYLRNRRKSKTG